MQWVFYAPLCPIGQQVEYWLGVATSNWVSHYPQCPIGQPQHQPHPTRHPQCPTRHPQCPTGQPQSWRITLHPWSQAGKLSTPSRLMASSIHVSSHPLVYTMSAHARQKRDPFSRSNLIYTWSDIPTLRFNSHSLTPSSIHISSSRQKWDSYSSYVG